MVLDELFEWFPNVKGTHKSNTFGKRILKIYVYILRDRKQRERWGKKTA
jgi:hypothetical protein